MAEIMNSVNYTNLNTGNQALNPDINKKLQNNGAYGALDKEKLKQDTVQIAQDAKQNVKENFIYRTMRDLGCEDPKKTLKSLAMSLVAVVGFAVMGNKLSTPSAKLGEKIDDIFLDNSKLLGKVYGAFTGALDKIKGLLSNTVGKLNIVQDIKETLSKRRLSMETNMARGYERGPKGIYLTTIREVFTNGAFDRYDNIGSILPSIKKALNAQDDADISKLRKMANDLIQKSTEPKDIEKYKAVLQNLDNYENLYNNALNAAKKAFGDDKAKYIVDNIKDGIETSAEVDFYKNMTKDFIKHMKDVCPALKDKTKMEILDLASKNKIKDLGGPDLSEFVGVKMKGRNFTLFNLMSDWWPVNIVETVARKITGKKDLQFGRGNLFDAMIKFDVVSGTGAKTLPGKLVQIVPSITGEAISNQCCDKAGMGLITAFTLMNTFNNIQDAPKEQKLSTATNRIASDVLYTLFSTQAAAGIIYGTASLRNLQGKGIMTKLLKGIGSVVGVGLGQKGMPKTALTRLKGFGGGLFRFFLFMFVVSPKIGSVIDKFTNKFFGTPYDKDKIIREQEAKKQQEAQLNTIIPELGITQGELMKKIQANPKAMEDLNKRPELVQLMQKNPKLLIDYLDGKDITKQTQNNASQSQKVNTPISPINKGIIESSKRSNTLAQNTPHIAPALQNNKKQEQSNNSTQTTNKSPDTATYIPSSEFVVKNSTTLNQEQMTQYNQAMADADKVLRNAEKYI